MGVKASGGVKDLEQMKAMVAAGATRIGASAGVRIVKESRGEADHRWLGRHDRRQAGRVLMRRLIAAAAIRRCRHPGGRTTCR